MQTSRQKTLPMQLLFSPIAVILFFNALTALSHAQVPAPVQEMAFMRAGQYLYVQGGKHVAGNNDDPTIGQLFALDLAVSWDAHTPHWKPLSSGPSHNLYNGVGSPDNRTLTTFFMDASKELLVNTYDIQQDKWERSVMATDRIEPMQAIRPVLDPQSGTVYIAGPNNFYTYHLATKRSSYTPIPPDVLTSRFFSGAVYNAYRNSIMYLGGLTVEVKWEPQAYITEYSLGTATNEGRWLTFDTKGDLPTPRADHCMASSEDGRIVVIFGGRIPANMTATPPTNFTSTLYVLNVTSSIWSQEKSAPTPRLYTACIIIGNQFISWGGYDGLNTVSATPMIFDLTKRQWTKSYSPPDYYVNASHPSPRQPKSSPAEPFLPVLPSQSGSVNMVVILGGTFGALFVVALAGIVYLYMKRKSDRQLHDLKTQQEQSKDGAQAFASGSEKPDMSTNPNQQTPPHAYGRNPHAVVQNSHIVERHPQDAVAMGLVHDYTPVHVHTLNNQHSPIPVRHDATTISPLSPHYYSVGATTPGYHHQSAIYATTTDGVAVSGPALTTAATVSYVPNVFIPTAAIASPVIFQPNSQYSHYSPNNQYSSQWNDFPTNEMHATQRSPSSYFLSSQGSSSPSPSNAASDVTIISNS